jgi:hypothetical protein
MLNIFLLFSTYSTILAWYGLEPNSDLTKTGLSSRKKAQLHFPFCPTGKAT